MRSWVQFPARPTFLPAPASLLAFLMATGSFLATLEPFRICFTRVIGILRLSCSSGSADLQGEVQGVQTRGIYKVWGRRPTSFSRVVRCVVDIMWHADAAVYETCLTVTVT